MLPEFYQFQNRTKVIYGEGLALDFTHELEELGIDKFFIVSDRIIEKLGLVKQVKDALLSGGIKITGEFFDVLQDASVTCVKEISRLAVKSKAQGLIGIGGGSVIDAAKGANFTFTNGGDLIEDYSGAGILTKPLNPLIVIPTTAGTGSECTLAAMIYDVENKTKLAFSDQFLLPNLAVLDPAMTISMPSGLTASTGMDALTHAIEAYTGIDASPHADALSIAAIEHIFKNIVKATENGNDLEARGGMLIGANLAGIAFSHSMVGCVHGMAHAVGGLARVPHGIANAILLPHGMEYNFEQVKEKYAKLAPVMGEDISGLSIDDAAQKAIHAVKNLTARLNRLDALPLRLRDVGVSEDQLLQIANAAVDDGSSIYNPREVVAKEILVHIKNAY